MRRAHDKPGAGGNKRKLNPNAALLPKQTAGGPDVVPFNMLFPSMNVPKVRKIGS
jgi:hypothetical protein